MSNWVPPFQLRAADTSTFLDHICALDIESIAYPYRLSKIVCTIGPVSRSPEMLEKLMEVGMNVARLNFSHGTHEYHGETIKNIREAVKNYSKKISMTYPLAIALDTKGPEIRTGLLKGGASAEVELKKGKTIKLTSDKTYELESTSECLYINYSNIQNVVKPGNRIYIDDGLISVIVQNVRGPYLTCLIENGGLLGSKKGCNLPGIAIDLPAVSEKDKADLEFGAKEGVDIIFSSFTPNAKSVFQIKDILGDEGKNIQVYAKIENEFGMQNMDEIIQASDGIMVDRGDLGTEIPIEKVALAQKTIIARCNKYGKPIVCATHMLESMVEKPRPTRAETSDIANAVLDGSDCLMLSGETAKGKYPLECVAVMASIAKEAEFAMWQRQTFHDLIRKVHIPLDDTETIAVSVVEASMKSSASAIIVLTEFGKSAYSISKYRPMCPIIAVTRNAQTARHAQLYRAVFPLYFEGEPLDSWSSDVDARIKYGITYGKAKSYIKCGDLIIVVTVWKQSSNCTNTIRIICVSD